MTEEQQKKIKNRLTLLTIGIIFLLAILLLVLATTKKMNTIWFPVGTGTLLALYWVVSDVLPVIWLRMFEDKTGEQKRSYCIYALIDAVGLGGLLYFIMSLTSMTGALVYVASVFLKKRFHDEYLGIEHEEAEAIETDAQEQMTEVQEAEMIETNAQEQTEETQEAETIETEAQGQTAEEQSVEAEAAEEDAQEKKEQGM